MQHQILVRSCIKPSLLRSTLFRGTYIAIAGVIIIVTSGMLLPLFLLRVFGLPLLLLGFALIASGLLPYRRLAKLEMHPYEIAYDETHLLFFRNKKPAFKVPLELLQKIEYYEKGKLYGMGVKMKKSLKDQVIIYDKKLDIPTFFSTNEGFDLFLPYFTKSASDEMTDELIY